MAREYIIDGYNLLLRWRRGGLKPGPGNLERAREALVTWIARRTEDPSRITIVFDASRTPRAGLADSHMHGIRVVFSEGYASADDWIIKECQTRPRDRHLAIVSSDREIQLAARRAKAEIVSADSFISDLYTRADFDDDEEEELRSAMTPRSPTDENDKGTDAGGTAPNLTADDVAAFREVMKEADKSEKPGGTKPKGKSPLPKDVPPLKKEIREENEMGDFYRQMRDWENGGK